MNRARVRRAVLPTPRFSRGIGLVLHLFRGLKSAGAGCCFGASFYVHAAIFGLVPKMVIVTSCITLGRIRTNSSCLHMRYSSGYPDE